MFFRLMFFLYLFSLIYNIPVANWGKEVVLYDLLFVYFLVQFLCNKDGVFSFSKIDTVSKAALRFGLWCSLTFLVSTTYLVLIGRFMWVLMSVVYLYHLWGFIICTCFFRLNAFVDQSFLEKTIRALLIMGVLETLIIVGQNMQLVPYLWSKAYYDSYGGGISLSGTLGPNRVVPGSTLCLLFVLSIMVIFSKQNTLKYLKWIAYPLSLLTLLTIFLSGSRTGYISLSGFVFCLLLLRPLSLVKYFMVVAMLSAICIPFVFRSGSNISKRLDLMWRFRITDQVKLADQYADDKDYYSTLGAGRKGKLVKAANYIVDNPWIIPTGAGFNNRMTGAAKEGNSAHNLYLTMIVENGLVGLVLYLSIFFCFVRGPISDKHTLILIALFVCVCINIFFFESFYIYRQSFGLLGLLFIVASVIDIKRYHAIKETEAMAEELLPKKMNGLKQRINSRQHQLHLS